MRGFVGPLLLLAIVLTLIAIWPEFLDVRSLLLTLGGSVTVVCLSYSERQLRNLIDSVKTLTWDKERSLNDHLSELGRLTRLYRLQGLRGLENQERHLTDPYLKRGIAMLVDLQKEERIHAVLEYELAEFVGRHEISRQILVTLGKLLPAFGLIGTLIGMVLLLRNISSQDPQALPTAMSIAVLTTFYGAVFSNVIVSPLAARLHSAVAEKEITMRLTKQWVLMLARGEALPAIENRLLALIPAPRLAPEKPRTWLGFPVSSQR